MLFAESKSALVRLSDSLKDILNECRFSTLELLGIYENNRLNFEELQALARQTHSNDDLLKNFDKKAKELSSRIPEEEAIRGAKLQRILHSQSLQVVLTSCFALESYINSLAYFLFKEKDYLGLVRGGHETTAEIILNSIENMRPLDKWDALGRINAGQSFDKSRAPFQHCKIIFNFRNDIVHDKVTEYSSDRMAKRYGNFLPDPVFGMLDLIHANFAAMTYWGMTTEIHNLLNYDIKKFHGHYNLMPWEDDSNRKDIEKIANDYGKVFHNRN